MTTIDLPQRFMDSTIAALELFSVHIGVELGLYEVLEQRGPLTAAQLAELASVDERYAQEWLEQQAVAGIVDVARSGDAASRTYALPAEHRGVLVDPVDGEYLAPFSGLVAGIGGALDDVVTAFRTGAGVPYARYGAAFRHGQGAINRPAFTADLVKTWLPATAGVVDRLGEGARVVDLGTGLGWSAIAVKTAWPSAEVIGLDLDVASIDDARVNAERAGVDVDFAVAADELGTDIGDRGPVDLVLILETLHDLSRPVEVLTNARQALSPGGVVVVADEAVADQFTAPGDDIERLMYGWSVTHCLPACRVHDHSAALGTALRADAVADLARQAGFTACEVVDVDAGFFRIYRLVP